MSNIHSIDGHSVVSSEAERDARLLQLKLEGRRLLDLYRSIPDRAVRASILSVVKAISEATADPLPCHNEAAGPRATLLQMTDGSASRSRD